ncbi:hypothetical protein SDJN03_06827, partial [Cucurbita argyrosperma subsp. sororia]
MHTALRSSSDPSKQLSYSNFLPRVIPHRSANSPTDGLARAKASGADDADYVGCFCGGGLFDRLCYGIVSDDDVGLCWRVAEKYPKPQPQEPVALKKKPTKKSSSKG